MSQTWIVVPVKAPGAGKTRLAGVLGEAERHRLVAAMLARVVAAVGDRPDCMLHLLGPSRHGLAGTIPLIADPGGGLDAALDHARALAMAAGAQRIVFLAGDLPLLAREDVDRLLAVARDEIAIAADRAGQGTNALSLPLPAAGHLRSSYGLGSFARHAGEAERLGLRLRAIEGPGLATDIDMPDDLALLPEDSHPIETTPSPRT